MASDIGDTSPLDGIPSQLLRAELLRRHDEGARPMCGSGRPRGSYNTSLHVAALFLILGLSTFACSFPIIARRFPKLPIPHRFLFLSRHFGTGVLIATAFVHLLPTAFVSLTDPCLPFFWNKGYPAMAGLIAMAAVFLVVTIEMFFAMRGAGHMHGSEWDSPPSMDGETAETASRPSDHRAGPNGHSKSHRRSGSQQGLMQGQGSPNTPNLDRIPESSDEGGSDSDFDDLDNLDPITQDSLPLHHTSTTSHRHHHHSSLNHPPSNPQKLLLQCLLLEAGILFHSIFIGMALSVSTGPAFLVLLVAISFHQTFEGLALGARISALIPTLFAPSSPKPWLMALAYGATTPIGQALGLWMHSFYDPASAMGLLSVGITNAISSGLLLFAGLVELLAEDFLSDKSYEVLRGRRRTEACLSVAAGGVLMAIVGAFA